MTGWNLAGKSLIGANFQRSTMIGADLSGADCDYAEFSGANLTGANFSGATILSAHLNSVTDLGFTAQQLYSTASYQNGNLYAIQLSGNNLSGWNFAGQNLSGFADLSASNMTNANFHNANLYYAGLSSGNLTNADLSGANLICTEFQDADLTGANLAGATISATRFGHSNLSAPQLYSTASYQTGQLYGIDFSGLNMSGWNFAGQDLTYSTMMNANLTNANLAGANLDWMYFNYANLTNACLKGANLNHVDSFDNLTNADMRNAKNTPTFAGATLTGADLRGSTGAVLSPYAITHNTILHNGTINGLALAHGESLVVRNHETTIHVTGTPAIDNDAVIRMMFDDSGIWGSTLSFDPGTLMTLAGTLELDLEAGVSLSSLAGQSFQLFDWTGVSHDGSFSIVGDPAWDISDLYLTGVVRLPPEFEMGMMARMGGPSPMTANLRIDGTVVPEPSTRILLCIGLLVLLLTGVRSQKLPFPKPQPH
jgi:uncharacterized protein YjbI with pentapeptide repeats